MNLGINAVMGSNAHVNYSAEYYLGLEVAYNIAENDCQSAISEGHLLFNAIDNVVSLNSVANRFGSTEAFAVIKNLVGKQTVGFSMEGFVKDAWNKFIAWIKKMWGKFKNWVIMLWNKIKSWFKGGKATSSTAAKFAKAHPEAAKAVDNSALEKAKAHPKSGEKKDASPKKDTPSQLAAICEAAPNVKVGPNANVKITKPGPVLAAAKNLQKHVSTVLVNLDKAMVDLQKRCDAVERAVSQRGASDSAANEADEAGYSELAEIARANANAGASNAASTLAAIRTKPTPEVVEMLGGAGIKDFLNNPKKNLEGHFQMEDPTTLKPIGEAIRGYEAAVKVLEPVSKELMAQQKKYEAAHAGMHKTAVALASQPNAMKQELQNILTATMSKLLAVVNDIFKGVTGFYGWIMTILNNLTNKEPWILHLEQEREYEEAQRRAEGTDPDEI